MGIALAISVITPTLSIHGPAAALEGDEASDDGIHYSDIVSTDQPVLWWRLSETSGPAVDVSNNGRDGTYAPTAVRGVDAGVAETDLAVRSNGSSEACCLAT